MEDIKTLTVDELIAALMRYPQDTKVYMSHDEEGNGYGTTATDAVDYSKEDKALILFPVIERLDYDDVFPKQWEKESDD